jgi:hypothetical protein
MADTLAHSRILAPSGSERVNHAASNHHHTGTRASTIIPPVFAADTPTPLYQAEARPIKALLDEEISRNAATGVHKYAQDVRTLKFIRATEAQPAITLISWVGSLGYRGKLDPVSDLEAFQRVDPFGACADFAVSRHREYRPWSAFGLVFAP